MIRVYRGMSHILVCVFLLIPENSDGADGGSQASMAGPFLGQESPGQTPQIFAPGIVSTGLTTRDLAMTPDGTEIYFSIVLGHYAHSAIAFTKQTADGWTDVEVAPFSGSPDINDLEPFITPDGKRFLFLSNRGDPKTRKASGDQDIWVMDRRGNGWSKPYNLGSPVNSKDDEFFPSVTRDGTIYFTRGEKGSQINHIFRSRMKDGSLMAAEKLPQEVNAGRTQFNAYVDPDERFLILSIIGLDGAFGRSDYYICFRNDDDSWEQPINLGKSINEPGQMGYSPYISPDGSHFFFMSTGFTEDPEVKNRLRFKDYLSLHNAPNNGNANICWVSADFLNGLRKVE